jgi:hypothetical protein
VVQTDLGRAVILPKEFVLEGRYIILRQERDGLITIFPGTDYGREVMWREFNPLRDDNAERS